MAEQAQRATKAAPAVSLETQHAVEQFLYRQAEILDDRRWQDWLTLFTKDGSYWMPADPAHDDPDGVPSIFHEDFYLMQTCRLQRHRRTGRCGKRRGDRPLQVSRG